MRISALQMPDRWCSARANDNIPVKMVAVIYARPPQAIFCAADAGLKTPKDLEGKSIANPAGGSIPDMFPAFAKAAGIDASKVNWVVAASSALPGLLASGKVPCVGQFTVGEPLLRAQAAPKKLVRFAYSDPGLNYLRQRHHRHRHDDQVQSRSGPPLRRRDHQGVEGVDR